eukprot:513329-Rhodomonas_salina.3
MSLSGHISLCLVSSVVTSLVTSQCQWSRLSASGHVSVPVVTSQVTWVQTCSVNLTCTSGGNASAYCRAIR